MVRKALEKWATKKIEKPTIVRFKKLDRTHIKYDTIKKPKRVKI